MIDKVEEALLPTEVTNELGRAVLSAEDLMEGLFGLMGVEGIELYPETSSRAKVALLAPRAR